MQTAILIMPLINYSTKFNHASTNLFLFAELVKKGLNESLGLMRNFTPAAQNQVICLLLVPAEKNI